MKKKILITLSLAACFCLGFAVKTMTTPLNSNTEMRRVTGIGGIFFKCKDPEKMTAWYQQHLGLKANPYGAYFEWYETPDSTRKARTQWTLFAETSTYFEPSKKNFMINYRVENMEALVKALKTEGVTVVDTIETYDYGKFVHILDPEGNKVQLWEPVY